MKKIGVLLIALLLLHSALIVCIYFHNLHHSQLLGIFAQFGFLCPVIYVASVCLWIYTIFHALRNSALTTQSRIIWILLIVLLNVIGSIFYCYIAPSARKL